MFLRFCPFRASIWCFCFTYPGCRFACPGLGASLGFQPAINLSIHGQYPHFSCKKSVEEVYEQIFRYVSPKYMFESPIGEGVDELAHGRRVFYLLVVQTANRTPSVFVRHVLRCSLSFAKLWISSQSCNLFLGAAPIIGSILV